MKKRFLVTCTGIVFAFLFSVTAGAQAAKAAANYNKVLADTTFLQAFVTTLAPGEKTDMHTHSANFFYALTDGKIMVHYKNGKNVPYDLKVGLAGVSGPEDPHVTENVGTTTVKFIVVELKEHPYRASK